MKNNCSHDDKCEKCINKRPVLSENGLHYCCSLPDRQAVLCRIGAKNFFVSVNLLYKEEDM